MEQVLTLEERSRILAMYPLCPLLIYDDPTPNAEPVTDYLQGVQFKWDAITSEHTTFKQKEIKLVLKQLKYMVDADIYMLCYWYDSVPFQGTLPNEWKIEKDGYMRKVFHKKKGHTYIFDTLSGDVNIQREGMRSHLGTATYAVQFHMKHHYALPIFFGPGHWANGKTPFQLGIAVPDRQPIRDALMNLYDNNITLVDDYFFDRRLHNIDLTNLEVFETELIEINKQINGKR
jgi:hypothetical protein